MSSYVHSKNHINQYYEDISIYTMSLACKRKLRSNDENSHCYRVTVLKIYEHKLFHSRSCHKIRCQHEIIFNLILMSSSRYFFRRCNNICSQNCYESRVCKWNFTLSQALRNNISDTAAHCSLYIL